MNNTSPTRGDGSEKHRKNPQKIFFSKLLPQTGRYGKKVLVAADTATRQRVGQQG